MWYSDMQYKIAVHQQQESWESIVTLITSLFASVREIELTRRTEIKVALLNTVSTQLYTIIVYDHVLLQTSICTVQYADILLQ
jgi:hypothetical protein